MPIDSTTPRTPVTNSSRAKMRTTIHGYTAVAIVKNEPSSTHFW